MTIGAQWRDRERWGFEYKSLNHRSEARGMRQSVRLEDKSWSFYRGCECNIHRRMIVSCEGVVRVSSSAVSLSFSFRLCNCAVSSLSLSLSQTSGLAALFCCNGSRGSGEEARRRYQGEEEGADLHYRLWETCWRQDHGHSFFWEVFAGPYQGRGEGRCPGRHCYHHQREKQDKRHFRECIFKEVK